MDNVSLSYKLWYSLIGCVSLISIGLYVYLWQLLESEFVFFIRWRDRFCFGCNVLALREEISCCFGMLTAKR